MIKLSLILCLLNIFTSSSGDSTCPCISSNSETLTFTQSSTSQTFDNSTQGISCSDHDTGLAPFCDSSPPSFCGLNWCYVDSSCEMDDYTLSGLFSDKNLQYSQKTCGDEQNFAKFITNASKTSFELKGMVDDYVKGFRSSFITAMEEKTKNCPVQDSCGYFDSNPEDATWLNTSTTPDSNMKVEFDATLVNSPSSANTAGDNQRLFTCESKALEQAFLAASRTEYKEADTSRVAQMQGGEINEGNYVQWPITESCFGDQDPRFRDWFANAATGPKDVIIIIDTSGSMGTGSRIPDARAASKAIIDTLTEFDQAGLILFNSTATKQSNTLIPMTTANKNTLKSYIDSNVIPFGGTNFEDAFDKAFEMIKDSQDASITSTCLKAILFLTDGEADLDVDKLVSRNEEQLFKIFAQALGSGANTTVTKAVSCRTDAISQQVPDGGNLANYMAGYFHYFAAGIKDDEPRWIYQDDIVTGEELLSACVSLQDGTLFKGVTCMDMNVILELSVLQAKSDYNSAFMPALTTSNTTCPVFSFSASGIDIEDLRRNSGGDSCNEISVGVIIVIILSIVGVIVVISICVCIGQSLCKKGSNTFGKNSSSSSLKQKKKKSSSSSSNEGFRRNN